MIQASLKSFYSQMNHETGWGSRERIYVLCILAFSFLLASRKIETPGLYYDEMLFVNAARGGVSGFFVEKRLLGIPVLMMNYIGALKAWIYYPIFSVFPVSPQSIRLPSIILAQAGGIFSLFGLCRLYGTRILFVGAPLLLLDPSVLMHSRLDWGPNALMFLMRGLLVFAMCGWLARPDPRWMAVVFAAIALGIFDKLNFLWCAIGFCGAFGIVFCQRIWAEIRGAPWSYGSGFALIAVTLLASAYRATHVSAGLAKDPITWHNRVLDVWNLLRLLLAGGGAVAFVSGDGLRFWPWIWPAWILVLALVAVVWWRSFPQGRARLSFWILASLGTAALFAITKLATGPHHAAMLAALPQLVLLCAFAETWADPSPSWKNNLQAGVLVGSCYLSFVFVAISYSNVNRFAEPSNPNWDPANDQAAKFAAGFNETVITGDWGLATQLLGHIKDTRKVLERWSTFANRTDADKFVLGLDRKDSFIIVYHLRDFEAMRGTSKNIEESFEAGGYQLLTLQTFPNVFGKPEVRVARVESKHF